MLKTTKKVIVQLLVALTLASASLNHECSNNCFSSCSAKFGCGQCYERKAMIVGPKGSEKQICSSKPQPASGPCLLYFAVGCNLCKPGYALKSYKGKPCVKGTIQNCQLALFDGGQQVCGECLGGYPNSDGTRCIPTSQVKNPIPLCTVGSADSDNGSLACAQCEAGYVVDKIKAKCVKTLPSLKGCLISFDGFCLRCDVKNGYFMRDEGKCSKNGSN